VVVLHASWLEERLHLWAERWPMDGAAGAPPPQEGQPPLSPWDAPPEETDRGLTAATGASYEGGDPPVLLAARLPTFDGRPAHSRETWRLAASDAPGTPAPSPAAWQVSARRLSWRAQFALLAAAAGESRRLADGVVAGDDLAAWAQLFRFAGALVARQAFLPALVPAGEGWESRWQPAFDGSDRQRLYALAARLPASALCLASDASDTSDSAAAAGAFVADTLDRLVRCGAVTTLSRAHAGRGRFYSAHDAWLAALRGDDRAVRWPRRDELAALADEIANWRRPVDLASRADWRLALRLEEPPAGGDRWRLRCLAQPFDRPEGAEPLDTVWRDRTPAGAGRRELALIALGQAAALCPFIGRSLEADAAGEALATGEAHEFLTRHAPLLTAAGFGVLAPAWWQAAASRPRIELVAQAASPADPRSCSLASLVDVNWQVALGGEAVTIEELEKLAGSGGRLVRFRDRWIELEPRQAEEALRLWRRGRAEERSAGDIVRMMIGLDAEAHGMPVAGVRPAGWIEELVRRLRGEAALEDLPPPDGFCGELRPYQRRGYAWLAFLRQWRLGACLADDMGLGKTVQALALILRERERGERRPVLLVCPTSVIGNWEREAARFTPGLSVLRHHGPDRLLGQAFAEEAPQHALVVTGYALVPRDYAALRQVSWAGVVLDEAQNVKNPETRQSQAARALAAEYRLALTGTPVENHVGDLWSIMDFLNPGLLGSRRSFREKFQAPIQAGADPEARGRLRRATAPFVLRRLKTDRSVIADLPEKTEARVFCPLTREQAALYAAVLQELEASLEGAAGIARRGLVLAIITRLKQVCNHPAHYAGDGAELAGRSGKLDRLTAMLDETLDAGDRALVFTQFAAMGALLQRHIGQTFGFEPPFLHGGVPLAARDRMVAAFQAAGGPPVFVLSLRAGGTGLNLTAASHVFHFDRWWNPAVENQATDRAFRIGQTRNVLVHKLVCAGTLEERIDALIASKTAVAEEVIGSGEAWLTELPDEQLKRVLALSPDAVVDDGEEGE
jgi:hypothetical protein